MTPFILSAVIPDGSVCFVDSYSVEQVMGAQGYTMGLACGTFAAVDSSDTFTNGARFTSAGKLRLYDATSALPAGTTVQDGYAFTSTGQLCVTTGSVPASASFLGGVAVRSDGAVYAVVVDLWLATDGLTYSSERASAWASGRYTLAQESGSNQPIVLPYSGTKYLWLPGVNQNCATTPDSAALSITGDIDIRAEIALVDWTALNGIAAKYQTAGQQSYSFHTNGNLSLRISTDGTVSKTATASTTVGFSALTKHWVRATYAVSSGDVKFYTSEDGSSWTQLGATQSVAAGAIFDGTTALTIGDVDSNGAWPMSGKVYRVQIYNGINGTLAFDANFSSVSEGATSFTESSSNAATVTINKTGGKPAFLVGSQKILTDGAAYHVQGTFTNSAPYSVFPVGRVSTWTSANVLWDGNTANSFAAQQITGTPQIRLHDASADGSTISPTLGTRYVFSADQDAAGAASFGLNLGSRTSDTLSHTNMAGFTFGASGDALKFGAGIWDGVALVNAAVSAARRTFVITALNTRLGVF